VFLSSQVILMELEVAEDFNIFLTFASMNMSNYKRILFSCILGSTWSRLWTSSWIFRIRRGFRLTYLITSTRDTRSEESSTIALMISFIWKSLKSAWKKPEFFSRVWAVWYFFDLTRLNIMLFSLKFIYIIT
jgi:hypothetical protein